MRLFKNLFHKPLRVPQIQPIRRELSSNEKEKLRDWLEHPATKLAMSVVEGRRPSVWPSDTNPDVRLHQIQGWELYRNNLLAIAAVTPQQEAMEEEYQSPEL